MKNLGGRKGGDSCCLRGFVGGRIGEVYSYASSVSLCSSSPLMGKKD